MAQEGSTPAKERVNIVYKPATAGASAEVELPLKVLVMGDYTGAPSDVALEDRKPINVDKDNFNQVMQQQNLQVELDVDNKLTDDPDARLQVGLTFSSLKDFEPEGIVQQVAPLQQLLQVRAALRALRGPMGNIPAFRKKIQALLGDASSRQKLMAELALSAGKPEAE